jgi:hypothetical protein
LRAKEGGDEERQKETDEEKTIIIIAMIVTEWRCTKKILIVTFYHWNRQKVIESGEKSTQYFNGSQV